MTGIGTSPQWKSWYKLKDGEKLTHYLAYDQHLVKIFDQIITKILYWLVFVNLTQTRVVWEEGPSVEEFPSSG